MEFSWGISNPERWCCESPALSIPANLEIQQWPQDWKRSVFIPIPKKGNAKECSNNRTIALISHASKVMLKILQARLQQYMNCDCPDVQAGFIKGRGTRDRNDNSRWIIEKPREFQKNFYFCFPGSSDGKESACNVRDPASIPGSGRSSWEGNGYPL